MSTPQDIATQVTTYIAAYPRLGEIITAITEAKGTPYLVGGTVRLVGKQYRVLRIVRSSH